MSKGDEEYNFLLYLSIKLTSCPGLNLLMVCRKNKDKIRFQFPGQEMAKLHLTGNNKKRRVIQIANGMTRLLIIDHSTIYEAKYLWK
jgi:hypothetical protein